MIIKIPKIERRLTMIREKTINSGHCNNCDTCGHILTNPGYHKMNRLCCGHYQQWYTYESATIQYDDGRDEKGRFKKRIAPPNGY